MTGSSDYSGYSFSELREQLENAELPALREAGLLDEDTIRHLESFRQHYDPESRPHYETGEPAWFYYNTEYYVEVVRREVGRNLRRAVKNGNIAVVEHATGLAGGGGSAMDFVDYEHLGQLIERPSLLLLLFGDTGSGKTMTGVRLAELWKLRVGGTILTNVRSLAEANDGVEYVEAYPDLLHYCVENPQERKLLVADELSSLMSGYAADRAKVEELMRPLVRKMRKKPFRLSIIGIGHRPGDIHPTMRNGELAYPSFKRDKKTMEVYESLASDETGEDEICTVTGIDLPDYTVDTNDSGNWGWGTDDEVLDAARELRDAGYGDMLELIRQLEDDDGGDENEDEEAELPRRKCRGHNRHGDGCGQRTRHVSGYCEAHREEWDGDPDPRLDDD
ncbi:ATP-binding protein [Natronomonas marina]|uniref:ATP-binding protein n=1 Tax=Natronomonas marina TaxID=2961939 RepID=UPI0020C9B81E|nr:ATP-binding protein [Natronomonas marina]